MINRLKNKILGLDVVLTFKFILVGIIGFIVNYALLRLSVNIFNLNKIVGEIIGTIFALQATFYLHNYWTYSKKSMHTDEFNFSLWQRYISFISSNTVGSLITILGFSITSHYIDSKVVSLGIAAIFGTAWNYFANLYLTWKSH